MGTKKQVYYFENENDYIAGKDWMLNFLNEELSDASKHEDPELVAEEIQTILDLVNESNTKDDSDWAEIWDYIKKINEETYTYQKSPDPITWGIWRMNEYQTLDFGYKVGYIESAHILPGGNIKIHNYKNIPPKIVWNLTEINQKGQKFYIASASVDEIEQVCSVPSMPDKLDAIESGKRILDSSRSPDEWQRKTNPKRIESIKEFVGQNNNIIANSPILFVRESSAVSIKNNKIEIDFSKFLIKETNKKITIWKDYKKKIVDRDIDIQESNIQDLRPIWLIDGQHRVRGLSRSKDGYNLAIPIIIFPPTFGLPMAAKIFAEINTLQESLRPLHKLFMQHRFKIVSPIRTRNFEAWRGSPETKSQSRANSLSYELIAKLASTDGSALKNKVKLLDQNDDDYYVKADQWVNFTRSWFLTGPYANFKIDEEDIYQEVNNYFLAFIDTVNHKGWPDKKGRWPDQTRNKSLLQRSTHFKVLLDIFPEVHHSLNPSGKIRSVKEFKIQLAPFKWVDWTNKDLIKAFGGGGEKGRSNLNIWMSDALGENSHPKDKVMSKSIKSKRGQGILAPPAKPSIEIHNKWPKKAGESIRFKSERPINARRRPTWTVIDNKNENWNNVKINAEGEGILFYDKEFDKIKFFKITVMWSNVATTSATTEIKFVNPNY
jgi:DGQHR domain-containing protein